MGTIREGSKELLIPTLVLAAEILVRSTNKKTDRADLGTCCSAGRLLSRICDAVTGRRVYTRKLALHFRQGMFCSGQRRKWSAGAGMTPLLGFGGHSSGILGHIEFPCSSEPSYCRC